MDVENKRHTNAKQPLTSHSTTEVAMLPSPLSAIACFPKPGDGYPPHGGLGAGAFDIFDRFENIYNARR
jgi:hypothetical protein